MMRWRRRPPVFSSLPDERPEGFARVLSVLWTGLRGLCFVLGAMVLSTIVFGMISASFFGARPAPPLPDKMVLYMELGDGFEEQSDGAGLYDPFATFTPTLRETVDGIEAAAKDARVKGMLVRMEGGAFSPAQAGEIRKAIRHFRAAGKFAAIYSSSYGDGGGGLGRFYIASAFEERWMQPLGIVSIPGISLEMPFFRGTLDKFGIEPQFYKRREYKTAFENVTDTKMSPQNREMVTSVVNDLKLHLVKDISGDLKLTPAQFGNLVDKGLFTAQEALQEKLITHADYVDVLVDRIVTDITGNPESDEEVFVDIGNYILSAGTDHSAGNPKVALIYATGVIMDTRSGGAPPGFGGDGVAAADEIAGAILDAADDEAIKAIVLRVDSPGGSPVASETILRTLQKAKAKGKTIIVSMGTTAASGGYWIASSADHIFAMPATLTGSIGVVGGKFSARGLSEKLGVSWDGVEWGKNASLWSYSKPFSASEAERMNASLDQVYSAFTARVAAGRKLTPEQVENLARGRVWTGAQARANGLADEIGGLRDALDYTAKTLGQTDASKLHVIQLPPPRTRLEKILDMIEEGGWVKGGLDLQVMQFLAPLAREVQMLGNLGPRAVYEPLRLR